MPDQGDRYKRLAHPRKVKSVFLRSVLSERPHARCRRTIRAWRHGIAADVLLRSIAKHPIPFLPSATQRRRVALFFSILIAITGESGLLSPRFFRRADCVLVLPCSPCCHCSTPFQPRCAFSLATTSTQAV